MKITDSIVMSQEVSCGSHLRTHPKKIHRLFEVIQLT